MLKKITIAAAVMVAVTGFASAYQAPAQGGRAPTKRGGAGGMRRGGRNAGSIASISGTTYTIKTMRGTEIKANIAADTPVVKPDRSAGAIADLQTGVFVSVQGQPGADGEVKAMRVMIQNPMTLGTIQAISAKRITVRAMDGKFAAYLINAKTTFRKARQVAAWTEFNVGDQVTVEHVGAAAVTVRTGQAGRAGGNGAGGVRQPGARRGTTATPAEPVEGAKPEAPAAEDDKG